MAKNTLARQQAKEKLIQSFIDLVAEIGAHQVTLQKTAKRAKVPFSTAHYYYGGDWNRIFKDAVQAVRAHAQSFTAAYLLEHSTAKSNPVELYIEATFEWILEHRMHSRLWLFNYYFASLNSKFTAEQDEIIQIARQRVASLLYEAKGRNFYPELEVTPDLANAVHTIVFGVGIMAIIQNVDAKRVGHLKRDAIRQVRALLR